jgi:hypothetical protein
MKHTIEEARALRKRFEDSLAKVQPGSSVSASP